MIKERVIYLDILRVMSILAVVFLHSCSRFLGKLNMCDDGWYLSVIGDAIARWGVPIFFMISGALLLSDKREIKIYSFFKNRCRYILVPFVTWSAIYTVLKHKDDILHLKFVPIGMSFLSILYEPAAGHLWFVYIIFGFYVVSPILKTYVASASTENFLYLLGLSFTFSILFPLGEFFLKTTSEEVSGSLLNYLFYFIWGYYLYVIKFRHNRLLYALACLGVVVTIVGTYFVSKNNDGYYLYSNYFFKHNSINVMLMASGVFLIVKNFKWDDFIDKLIYKDLFLLLLYRLSSLSYGIYLMHVYVLDIIFFKFPVVISPFNMNTIVAIAFSFVCCLLISCLVCGIMSKHKVLNYLLVGSKV